MVRLKLNERTGQVAGGRRSQQVCTDWTLLKFTGRVVRSFVRSLARWLGLLSVRVFTAAASERASEKEKCDMRALPAPLARAERKSTGCGNGSVDIQRDKKTVRDESFYVCPSQSSLPLASIRLCTFLCDVTRPSMSVRCGTRNPACAVTRFSASVGRRLAHNIKSEEPAGGSHAATDGTDCYSSEEVEGGQGR